MSENLKSKISEINTIIGNSGRKSLTINAYPEKGTDLTLEISGSKNSALPMIMYCFLLNEGNEITLTNVPNITDVLITLKTLKTMGGNFEYSPEQKTLVISKGIDSNIIPTEFIRDTRISVVMMSVLLVKFGKVTFPKMTGGCNLGERKYDYHLDAFKSLGCQVDENNEECIISWNNRDVDTPVIEFPRATTTGTENALFLSNFCNNDVLIKGSHLRPEIIELIEFMNQLGSNIKFSNSDIFVENSSTSKTSSLSNNEQSRRVIDDVEDLVSMLVLSIVSKGSIIIPFKNHYLYAEIDKLIELSNGAIHRSGDKIIQTPFDRSQKHSHALIETGPYPNIGSDSQPIFASLLLEIAKSFSIKDTRFNSRFAYAEYLRKFGVPVETDGDRLDVFSIPEHTNSEENSIKLICHDLRSAMNAILTSTHFQKNVIIENADILERGYEDIFMRLEKFGFDFSLTSS